MVCSQKRHLPMTDVVVSVCLMAGGFSKLMEPRCPMWNSWASQQSSWLIGAPGISIQDEVYVTNRDHGYRDTRTSSQAVHAPSAMVATVAHAWLIPLQRPIPLSQGRTDGPSHGRRLRRAGRAPPTPSTVRKASTSGVDDPGEGEPSRDRGAMVRTLTRGVNGLGYLRGPATASITPTVSPVTRAISSSGQPFRRAAAIAVSNAFLPCTTETRSQAAAASTCRSPAGEDSDPRTPRTVARWSEPGVMPGAEPPHPRAWLAPPATRNSSRGPRLKRASQPVESQ
jgi:hypothetical protein